MNKVWGKIVAICCLLVLFGVGFYGYQTYWAGSSPTVVQALTVHGDGKFDHMIKEKDINGGKLVFYINRDTTNQIVLDTKYVRKTLAGWKATRFGGEMSGSNITYHPDDQLIRDWPISYMYLPKRRGVALNPTIVGTEINPQFAKIEIHSEADGAVQQAKIVKIQGDLDLFYVVLNHNDNGPFDVMAYDSNGSLVKKVSINPTRRSSGSSVKVR